MIRDERNSALFDQAGTSIQPTDCQTRHAPWIAPYDCPGCGPGLIRRLREAAATAPEPAKSGPQPSGGAEVAPTATRTVPSAFTAVFAEARNIASGALTRAERSIR